MIQLPTANPSTKPPKSWLFEALAFDTPPARPPMKAPPLGAYRMAVKKDAWPDLPNKPWEPR